MKLLEHEEEDEDGAGDSEWSSGLTDCGTMVWSFSDPWLYREYELREQ